jgi:hypothetical protein
LVALLLLEVAPPSVLLLDAALLSVVPLLDDVVLEPDVEPEIAPEALIVVSLGCTVVVLEVVLSAEVAWLEVLEVALVLAAPAEDVSLEDVLVLVSTEQPTRPRARSADSVTRWFFFIFIPPEVPD